MIHAYSKSTAAKTSESSTLWYSDDTLVSENCFPRNWKAGQSIAVWFEKGFRGDPSTGRTCLGSNWHGKHRGLTPRYLKTWPTCGVHEDSEPKTGTCKIMEVHKLVTAIFHSTRVTHDDCALNCRPRALALRKSWKICRSIDSNFSHWGLNKKQSHTMRTIG